MVELFIRAACMGSTHCLNFFSQQRWFNESGGSLQQPMSRREFVNFYLSVMCLLSNLVLLTECLGQHMAPVFWTTSVYSGFMTVFIAVLVVY